jgi:Family of unknown function (DUF6510)
VDTTDLRLDGNAAAGALATVFAAEMTTAIATCACCGSVAPLGAVAVYAHGMGTILRCRVCDTALIRIAEIRGRVWLDLRGTRTMVMG